MAVKTYFIFVIVLGFFLNWLEKSTLLIRAEDIKPGDRVYSNLKNKGKYYPGIEPRRSGKRIYINYDGGDQEDTNISFVRV
jgi:hypothetical protein